MIRHESVQGLNKLISDINRLQRMPQSEISKGARRGANVILHEARAIAATRKQTGKMSKKLRLKSERYRQGKKVFQIAYPTEDKFPEAVKVTKDGTRYYYPSSQNYGFKTRNGVYKEGLHFFERSMVNKQDEAAKTIVSEIGKEVEKTLRGDRH